MSETAEKLEAAARSGAAADMTFNGLSRAQCEDFLFYEAQLLDEWRLEAWFALFTEDGKYEVPAANSNEDADPRKQLFYLADDHRRLHQRVTRLLNPAAHAEFPHSRLIHLISNVRPFKVDAEGVHVRSGFHTCRSRNEDTDVYVGHHHHILRMVGGEIRIAFKRTYIDMLNLRPQGSVAFIL